MAYNLHSRTFY